jgi:uncharacterized protein (UPF0548 family)
MLSIRRLGPGQLDALLEEARLASPTYSEIGASRNEVLPTGYHHVRVEERVGDAAAFDRAVDGLRTWVAHEGAGLRILPTGPVEPGATVIAVTSMGPAQIVAPCRIVAVFKEPDSFGFAYGTLPGHPEQGEESFVLERRDDSTYFSVRAFSKPVDPLARLSGPVGRAVQRSVTRRYVSALRRFVELGSSNHEG